MKKVILTLLFLLTVTIVWAQVPQQISYQSVIRDGNNVVVASSQVGIKISLLKGTATGAAVYVETHRKTTNANGLVSLEIGTGTVLSGSFASIDWANGPYLIQTETDPIGGTNYSIPAVIALNSVPYALNAGIANNLAGTLAIANGGTGATTASAARTALGLENVDNTSDAIKPVSNAVQTALFTKVDKVNGKELSSNDYSTAEKTKLAAITGTNTGDQDLSALATTAAVAQKANAADVTTSLATKVDKVTGKELSTNDYTTAEKAKLAAITGTNTGDQTNITGNAATATKLLTSVTINGIAFDGSANVTIPATGAVPYTGATQAVDLGAYDLNVNGLTVGRGNGNIATNAAIGERALSSNTTGTFNLASGNYALASNTTGSFNTATGFAALLNNTTGSSNVASGFAALSANTTGDTNLASGNYALASNTTGAANLASGHAALSLNTTGSNNTAIGYRADVVSGVLTNATAIGAGAIVNASDNIQLGNTSVTDVKTFGTLTAGAVTYPNSHGGANQVLTTTGTGTLTWATASVDVPYTGATAAVNLGAFDLTVNGLTVGRGNGNILSNTASGAFALSNTTGPENTASGHRALRSNTTGHSNTASGADALYWTTTGFSNTASGALALHNNTTGAYNTASGWSALFYNTTGEYNTASGYRALGSNTTGSNNVASGRDALFSNTTGAANTATGYNALYNNTTGGDNIAIGSQSLYRNISGSNNTAIGALSGYFLADGSTANTTSDFSVYLGSETKASADDAQNEIVIGYNAVGSGSNTTVIENASTTNAEIKGILKSNGQILALTTKTANYTALISDEIILCDATLAPITITLPTAVGKTGQTYTIKHINAGSNNVTINTTLNQTIDGTTTLALISNAYVKVISDGSKWWIIGSS